MSQSELPSANGGLGIMGGAGGGTGSSGEDRVHQKSYKRKYRKLRHKFKEAMRRSDELFRQEQLANQAIRRMQEELNRVLDPLLDLNNSSYLAKERRHNIGSPSRATPPRFLSPEVYTARYGKYPEVEDNDDVEQMDLDTAPAEVQAEETHREAAKESHGGADNESSDDDDDDDDEEEEDEKTPITGHGSKYNSDDDDGDTGEAYREEIREWNYKRGIAGTPPRSVREKMKADADNVRKEAEQHAKQAAVAAAAAEAEQDDKKTNGIDNTSTIQIKEENEDEDDEEPVELNGGPEGDALQPPPIVEDYRRGQTPEYLRGGSPFLMTLKEEREWYDEIDRKYDGGIPPLDDPDSPSAIKSEGDPRNPMSVYCWLRKNQPQVFLQNEELEGKKPGRGRGGRRKAVEVDSGDEGTGITAGKAAKSGEGSKTGSKRRKTNGNDAGGQPTPGSGGKGRARGGRKGEPSIKRQRR